MAVPLGIYGAAVNTLVTLGLWLIALAWLVSIMLTHLAIARFRLLLATAIASLALAATINALPSLQSFYWFSASIRYTFPLALLTLILAATISAPKQYSNRPRFAAIVIGAAAFSFLNAGFSEMYAVFQLTFFTLLLLAIFVIYYRPESSTLSGRIRDDLAGHLRQRLYTVDFNGCLQPDKSLRRVLWNARSRSRPPVIEDI